VAELFGDQPAANHPIALETSDHLCEVCPWGLDGGGSIAKHLEDGNLGGLETEDASLDRAAHKPNPGRRRGGPPRYRDRLESRHLCGQFKKRGCGHTGGACARAGDRHANVEGPGEWHAYRGAWPLPVQAPADPGDVALGDKARQLTLNGATRPRQVSGLDEGTQWRAFDPLADKLSRTYES